MTAILGLLKEREDQMSVSNITLPVFFTPGSYAPAFDPTKTNPTNIVDGEVQTVVANDSADQQVLIPRYAPFYADDVQVVSVVGQTQTTLTQGVDYEFCLPFISGSRATKKACFGGILIKNNTVAGNYRLRYAAIGGTWVYFTTLADIYDFLGRSDARVTAWEQYAKYETSFPVITTPWDKPDRTTMRDFGGSLKTLIAGMIDGMMLGASRSKSAIDHVFNFNKPHGVTKAHIGLGLLADYPPATDQQAADPTNNITYVSPRQLRISFSTATPLATNKSSGIIALNVSGQTASATDAAKGLTAAAFLQMASDNQSALGAVYNTEQVTGFFAPWTNTWPKVWNGQTYLNVQSLLSALQTQTNVASLEININTGKVWFPAGTTLPSLALT